MSAPRRYALLGLNLALHGLHQLLVLFIVFGWMWCETRLLHLAVLALVLLSWYGLGPLLGKGSAWGYCVLTDIHWKLRAKLGLGAREGGYIKYLADGLLGRDLDRRRAEQWAVGLFFASAAGSLGSYLVYGGC